MNIYIFIYICTYIYIYKNYSNYRIHDELRGIVLVRAIISQPVSAMALFRRSFSNSEFKKNYMTSNIFYFTMISLVTSQLSRLRLAEIRPKGSSMKVLFICSVLH